MLLLSVLFFSFLFYLFIYFMFDSPASQPCDIFQVIVMDMHRYKIMNDI